jgi:hypothetical protein
MKACSREENPSVENENRDHETESETAWLALAHTKNGWKTKSLGVLANRGNKSFQIEIEYKTRNQNLRSGART